MGLRVLWITLFAIWVMLMLMGKSGFIHLLFLNGVSVMMIDLVARWRSRHVERPAKVNGASQ